MKVVITTPTGNVGSRLVRLLLQAGVRPTLLLRDPDRLDAETRELVDTVQGDQLNAEDVLRATEGADALYWVDPPVDDEDPIATYARAGSHAARAIQEHAIARTVFQSSVGAENATARGRSTGSPVPKSSSTRRGLRAAPALRLLLHQSAHGPRRARRGRAAGRDVRRSPDTVGRPPRHR